MRRYFSLPTDSPRLHVHIGDAFDFLSSPPANSPKLWDAIIVDVDTENHVGPGFVSSAAFEHQRTLGTSSLQNTTTGTLTHFTD